MYFEKPHKHYASPSAIWEGFFSFFLSRTKRNLRHILPLKKPKLHFTDKKVKGRWSCSTRSRRNSAGDGFV